MYSNILTNLANHSDNLSDTMAKHFFFLKFFFPKTHKKADLKLSFPNFIRHFSLNQAELTRSLKKKTANLLTSLRTLKGNNFPTACGCRAQKFTK